MVDGKVNDIVLCGRYVLWDDCVLWALLREEDIPILQLVEIEAECWGDDVVSEFMNININQFSIYLLSAYMAHLPDTKPSGRQQHAYFNMFVDLNIHLGRPFPTSFQANSSLKWLQLHPNIW